MLAEQSLTRTDLERALAELERSEGIRIRSIVGINHDGVFGSAREGWRADLPDACTEPSRCSGSRVLELLGRAPQGSTARLFEDGTLPGNNPAQHLGPPDRQRRARTSKR